MPRQSPKVKRQPRPAAGLVTREQRERVAREDPARLELALAEALTGGDLRVAQRTSGLGRGAWSKALRRAQRDEYAATRDTARLKVINRMYDVLGDAVTEISSKIPDAKLNDLLYIVDKLGLRLSCIEANRTSLVEDLAAGSTAPGVTRTRAVIESVQAAGDLSTAEQAVLDKVLGISTVPSSAALPPAGVTVDITPERIQH